MNDEERTATFIRNLLEQYKLYLETADKLIVRRNQTNYFYISILSGLLAIFSFAINQEPSNTFYKIVLLLMNFLGMTLCLLWWIHIRSYKQLSSAKFVIIHEMEKFLPFACYKREWEILKEKKYIELTYVEKLIPIMFGVFFVVLIVLTFLNLLAR